MPCSPGAQPTDSRAPYPAFTGGTAVGQWRPTPPGFGAMSAQGLAFTDTFVLVNSVQFQPPSPRMLVSSTYTDDFNTVKALGRQHRLDTHRRPVVAGGVLGRQRQCSLEPGGKPDRPRQSSVDVRQQSASRRAQHRDGRYGDYHLERQAAFSVNCRRKSPGVP